MMRVFIPTYKRLHNQPTLQALSKSGVVVTLVVRPDELVGASKLAQNTPNCTVLTLPTTVTNIGQTRQWIVDNTDEERIIMMDDDLAFACRGKRTDNPLYLSPSDPEDVHAMVDWMYESLRDEALVGISAREGNNRKPEPRERNARMMRAWGFNKSAFNSIGARFDQMNCMEDFDVILTFLTNGYDALINNEFTTNQAGSNTDGGCSTYRTLEVQAEAAHALAKKYPGLVKVVKKETKSAWGGGERTDVTIYWKKAAEYGKRSHLL